VLTIDPNHINAAYARGACENKRGNFAKAIEDYHMALEKDQERPTSPGGSRKIKFRNMKYILDGPGAVQINTGTPSYQGSANKREDINAMLSGTGNFSQSSTSGPKVLNQINNNLPPKQGGF
jgi:tetratricopeptide (TPR) repeat protein